MTTRTAEDRVAQTILDQIGVGSLMRLGAHKVERYLDAARFNIKIAMPGQTRARIMRVTIQLTAADLYDLSIGYLDKKSLDWVSMEDHQGIYVDTMVDIMRQLAIRA